MTSRTSSRGSSGKRVEVTGVIRVIKEKETSKGICATYLCETDKGNKFWFMGWQLPWFKDDGDVDLSEFCDGQTITVEGQLKDSESIKVNDDGTKMMFLSPNPKLIRQTPLTTDMRIQKEYRNKLGELNNERLGGAIRGLVETCRDRLDGDDAEFIQSLAEGAAKYGKVSDKQRVFVVKLCAKYVTRDMTWRKLVDESLRSGASMSSEAAADQGEDFDGEREAPEIDAGDF